MTDENNTQDSIGNKQDEDLPELPEEETAEEVLPELSEEETYEEDLPDDDDTPDYEENELILEDIDVVEKNADFTKLRLLINDGTWKYLILTQDVLDGINETKNT